MNGAGERRLAPIQRSKDDAVELGASSIVSFAFDSGRVRAVEGAETTDAAQLILPEICLDMMKCCNGAGSADHKKRKLGDGAIGGYSLAQPDSYAF